MAALLLVAVPAVPVVALALQCALHYPISAVAVRLTLFLLWSATA